MSATTANVHRRLLRRAVHFGLIGSTSPTTADSASHLSWDPSPSDGLFVGDYPVVVRPWKHRRMRPPEPPSPGPQRPARPARPGRTVGLVLGAGGAVGWAWLVGTLAALQEGANFDARQAALIVGTSAGAGVAATLRGGLSAADQLALYRHEAPSSQGQALLDRAASERQAQLGQAHHDRPAGPRPGASEQGGAARRPAAWGLALAGLAHWPPRPGLTLAGLTPRGEGSLADLGARLAAYHPGGWPQEPTWIVAVRTDHGRRVVFGRDGRPRVDLATAVRASSAVPGRYEPIEAEGHTYVDGGAWSTTNADLVAGLGFDVVIVVAPLSVATGRLALNGERLRRSYHRNVLSREADLVHRMGTDTIVVEPDAADLPLLVDEATEAAAIAELARNRMLERLAADTLLGATLAPEEQP